MEAEYEHGPRPFKIVDSTRDKRYGIIASSLEELLKIASSKFGLVGPPKAVLELDGTEVDEEEYFSTLEKNTSFMVIPADQSWVPPERPRLFCSDSVDGGPGIANLLSRIQCDVSQVSLLDGGDLELLSDMDPDSLTDIIPDKAFLEGLKEASGRFLNDKRQAQDAMDLLKLYHRAASGRGPVKGTLAQ